MFVGAKDTYFRRGTSQWDVDTGPSPSWRSDGLARAGLALADSREQSVRGRIDTLHKASATLPFDLGNIFALDGSSRVWLSSDRGLAVVSLRDEKATVYPQGAPGWPLGTDVEHVAVVGGGPTLPPVPAPRVAATVTGAVNVNGKKLANATVHICSRVADVNYGDPCAHNEVTFSVTTDAKGAFTIENVPEGRYGIAFRGVTSEHQEQWAPISRAFVVRPGGTQNVGTLALTLTEVPHFGP